MRASLRFIMRVWSRWMRAEAHAVMGRLVYVGCGVGVCVNVVVCPTVEHTTDHIPQTHLTIMKASPASADGPKTWKIK